MSRFFSLTIFVALVAIVSLGCTSAEVPTSDAGVTAESGDAAMGKLCGGCGEAKGSEECCSDSAAKCDSCGKNKGSQLCCVELDESVAGKDLCGKCGHVAGGDSCCAEGAEKCDCGMAKGSPLCCKLKTEEKE